MLIRRKSDSSDSIISCRIAPEKVKWSDQQPQPKLLAQGVSSDANENKPKGPGLLEATERLGTELPSQSSRSSSSPGLTHSAPATGGAPEQPEGSEIATTSSRPRFTNDFTKVEPFKQGPSWKVIAGAAVAGLGLAAGGYCLYKRSQAAEKGSCLSK